MPFKPKRGLSQNFLCDSNLVQKILTAADVTEDELVVEIGPGQGALTKLLAQKTKRLIAIEKDQDLSCYLKDLIPSLEIYSEDFLKFPLEETIKKKLQRAEKAKVIANIPYHLTTPILKKICVNRECIGSAFLMVQKEVAEKLCHPDPKERSFSLTLIRSLARVKMLFPVPSGCFFPKPKVDSAVIQLELKTSIPIDIGIYEEGLRFLMQRKRKKIASILREQYPPDIVKAVLETLGLAEDTRPSAVSEEILLNLLARLHQA